MVRLATALFTANNRNTIGAYRAIRGRREPVAIDDFELADLLGLPLTVVTYDPEEFGRQTAALLCDRTCASARSAHARHGRVGRVPASPYASACQSC